MVPFRRTAVAATVAVLTATAASCDDDGPAASEATRASATTPVTTVPSTEPEVHLDEMTAICAGDF